MASRGDVTEASSPAATVRQSQMALAALALSVFAFIPPLGIAAVVLGHISSRDIAASQGKLNGKAIARAALVIGYVQMFLLTVAAVVIWLVLGLTLQDFRRDALVQRVLRESSANATLDYASAREEENTARALVIQMVAIEDQYYRGYRNYLCSVSALSQVGVEGSTPAERRAFYERLQASAYIFELRGCDSEKSASPALGYKLTAVPRAPRMPPDSLIYCTDETGTVLQTSSATSVDCFDHGYVILKPTTPRIQKAAVEPVVATPVQGPAGTCDPSEKTPRGADMGVVRAAWTSPEALWEFLTLPETGAPERRIAASKAGQIIPLGWLPKVLQARRELRKEQALHNFGLADYPFKDYSPFGALKKPATGLALRQRE